MVTKLYVAQGQIAKVHAPLYAYQVDGEGQASASESQTKTGEPTPAELPVELSADLSKTDSSQAEASIHASTQAPGSCYGWLTWQSPGKPCRKAFST
ncbi:hypothetical protein HSBAA_34890 [Vreelandella sulfidaeris]|uniref:Uncharacterized protein n=1 Tax=Vreelandella sulfidaeris TaxID=115553 RepID=A0A455UA90_9GAMM|nr:hypothetical protein HSBAA_34890 [Halomonas sulfidaeris]